MTSYITAPRVATDNVGSAAELTPAGLDPATHPIIARHWFGIEPLRPISQIAAEAVADLRRRRHVQKVHRLGDRVFGELLAEIGAERGIITIIDQKLERYAELEPKVLEAAGGDEFWQPPLHGVDR